METIVKLNDLKNNSKCEIVNGFEIEDTKGIKVITPGTQTLPFLIVCTADGKDEIKNFKVKVFSTFIQGGVQHILVEKYEQTFFTAYWNGCWKISDQEENPVRCLVEAVTLSQLEVYSEVTDELFETIESEVSRSIITREVQKYLDRTSADRIKRIDDGQYHEYVTPVNGVEFDTVYGSRIIRPGIHKLPFRVWRTVEGELREVRVELPVNVFATFTKDHVRYLLIEKQNKEFFTVYLNGICKHLSTEDDIIIDDLISAVKQARIRSGESVNWIDVRREIVDDEAYFDTVFPQEYMSWPYYDKAVEILSTHEFESESVKRIQNALKGITEEQIPQGEYLWKLVDLVRLEDPTAYENLKELIGID